ncbi:hypothetical protein ACIGCK_10130 [Microbacterium sp. NPDC078428]|uniref:hypothetical protein n=1 Tax=Microbacterium sp. NPDC078428 TaxID=3364190 RepID=UPI0037CB4CE4
MVTALRTREAAPPEELRRLRAEMDRVRGRRVSAPVFPVHPRLADLLPERGLRPGSVYALEPSPSLLLGLMATASRAGSWCGVVGVPSLGVEAAEGFGLDLSRLVLVPEPGARWLAVASALAEVLPLVAVRPPERVRESDAARLTARLRDRGCALLTLGDWPGADALLSTSDPRWQGVGAGDGYLAGREVTVTVSSRRFPVPRSTRVMLPDAAGAVDAAVATSAGTAVRGAVATDPSALEGVSRGRGAGPVPIRAAG